MKGLRQRWMLPVGLVAMLVAASVFGVRPMASYRALALGASAAQLGIIASSFAALAIILAIPLGRIIDRLGEPPVIRVGVGLVIASTAAIPLTTDVLTLAATQSILGVGQLMVVVGSHTLIANHGPVEGRAHRFGLYASVASVGHGIGPAVGGWLIAAGKDDLAFLSAAACAAVALLLTAMIPSADHQRVAMAGNDQPSGIRTVLRLAGIRTAMVAGVMVLITVDLLVAYLPAYGEERGISPALIGTALGCLALSQTASRLALGTLVDRFGPALPLAGSMTLAALALPIIAFEVGEIGLLAVMLIVGSGLGIGQPLSLAWVAMRTPIPVRGLAMGVRMGGNRLGQLLLPALIGATAGRAGPSAVLWCLSGLLALSAGHVLRSRAALEGDPLALSEPGATPDGP